LVARAASGEEIIIGKAGVPMVRLVPYRPEAGPVRRFGYWKGRVTLAAGWDAPDTNAEIETMFVGNEDAHS
jgi:antitoxin (DNA-binding transcriptional repressor) of toxin-antitoxin stability system